MAEPSGRITPVDWRDSLERSKAQIAGEQRVDLLSVLDRLRISAEKLEAERVLNPEGGEVSDET